MSRIWSKLVLYNCLLRPGAFAFPYPIRLKHNKRPIVLFVVRSMDFRHHYPGPFASYPGGRCSVLNAAFDPHPTVSYSSDPVRSRPSWPLRTLSTNELQKNGCKRLCRSARLGDDPHSSKAQAAGPPVCLPPPIAPALDPIISPTSTPSFASRTARSPLPGGSLQPHRDNAVKYCSCLVIEPVTSLSPDCYLFSVRPT